MTHAERTIRNVIKNHGLDAAQKLVADLKAGISYEGIAAEMGVSRARVGQWALVLGQRVTAYTLHPDVQEMGTESAS